MNHSLLSPARLCLAPVALLCSLAACSPEVGSEKWCQQLDEKPKGDWSANELKDYTKYCVLDMPTESEKSQQQGQQGQ